MIKQILLSKIRFFLLFALLLFIGYILEINLIVPLFLIALFFYIKAAQAKLGLQGHDLLNLSLLFMLIFALSYSVIKQGGSVLYIPFCVIPMLATILFHQLDVSVLLTFASSIAIASISSDFYLGVLYLISGILSGILVFNNRRRSQIIHAGLIVGLVQAASLFLIKHFQVTEPQTYFIALANGIFSSIIVIGVLPVFEYIFGTATDISLLEMADFNHPLLQRMVLEAPGTYHHSLVVGNLAESACQVVGANALLARIGAYYHDIGKLQKPEYFSENQSLENSKHDSLSPTMSKMVIMNHVRDGMELAKKNKLNPALIEFILQHHGNSLVYYFYRRALENLEDDQEIREEGFRYPGPKPNTKETAIVLLADSVEAATRALKEPAPTKIQEVAHKIINNKFIDGQLDECDLTLKDLEGISAVFVRILSGIYHSRTRYPESPTSENSHNKSAKENSHLSEKDKKNGS
jgi:hypothetical protein